MGKGFKAGLLALTALTASAPAFAQQGGGWQGNGAQRGGGEMRGGGNRGGENRGGGGWGGAAQPTPRADRPQGGWQQGGSAAGGAQRGWNGNGGGVASRPQADVPRPVAPVASPDRPQENRQWRQGQWSVSNPSASGTWRPGDQGNIRPDGANGRPVVQRPDARPDTRPDWNGVNGDRNDRGSNSRPNAGWNPGANPGSNSGPNPGWQNRPPVAGAYGNRGDGGRWDGRGAQRPQASYGWENRDIGRGSGGRVSNSDRWRDQQRWSNNWRRDSRYDWSGYRRVNRDYYRLPAYRPPSGWSYGYSRFSIGLFMGGPLYSNSYWIDDPYSYRLPPAYGTLRWVRYYDDALLVDIRDGYVVDVINDFFW